MAEHNCALRLWLLLCNKCKHRDWAHSNSQPPFATNHSESLRLPSSPLPKPVSESSVSQTGEEMERGKA